MSAQLLSLPFQSVIGIRPPPPPPKCIKKMPKRTPRNPPKSNSNKDELIFENQSQSQSTSDYTFADELIFEILKWLPVKSLKKFSCVSKSWLAMISSPYFIESHLKKCKEKYQQHHRLVFVTASDEENGSLKQFECPVPAAFRASYKSRTKVTNCSLINPPLQCNDVRKFQIVGSCNGLVCVMTDEDNMFFWNPATRKSRKLPNCNMKSEHSSGFGFSSLSFAIGYGEFNDDYKVLGLSCVACPEGRETVAKVYSSKTDSWKKIENFKYNLADVGCYFLNHKFHFTAGVTVMFGDELNYERKFVSLDLENDVYGEVELPEYMARISGLRFGTLGGCLALWRLYMSGKVELWVMKEYGVRESWAQTVVVPSCREPDRHIFSRPLIYLKDGQLLFRTPPMPKLAVYDPIQDSVWYPKFSDLKNVCGVDVYVQSLVAP